MKSFNRLFFGICALLVLVIIGANVYLSGMKDSVDRPYMVEVERVANALKSGASVDTDNYTYVKKVIPCEDEKTLTEGSRYDYCIRDIDGKLYRIEYIKNKKGTFGLVLIINLIIVGISIITVLVLVYVREKIIKPFHELSEVPYELSKGNMTIDIPEEKTKFFGRFVWGTNMLRDNIEERRQKELELQRQKKLMIMSITHDLKTPLSVIKLNGQALDKNLYKDEEKRSKAVKDILTKTDEIERYITDITSAANEDFLDYSVKEEEFYLKDIIDKLEKNYIPKLELNKTELVVDSFENILLSGDEARIYEVFQNIIDNAIKYGDGEKIHISFDREEDCELVTVSNTGEGVREEEIMKLFDSFFRGANATDKPGTGLGLHICRKLMNNMNGDIFVKQTDKEFSVTTVIRMS